MGVCARRTTQGSKEIFYGSRGFRSMIFSSCWTSWPMKSKRSIVYTPSDGHKAMSVR